ncbi:MAG TPA: hypothetical protein VI408_12930 [Gaiellaceae bacterium]
MKRALLILVALAFVVPQAANAKTPCRNKIYNDWYPDGKIATTYPIACYRDALKHIHSDALTYSSLADDIRSAMQAALERARGKHVPAAVGKGGKGNVSPAVATLSTKTPAPRSRNSQPSNTSTVAAAPTSGSGGGIPTPILILGGLAILLAALGAAGAGAKRFRRRPGA